MVTNKSTKQLLAESLAQLMQSNSLEHITVNQIAENCGLTRRTFYNNFADKYALVDWLYENEAIGYLSLIGKDCSWYSAILNKLKIIKKNQAFYSKVYRQEMFLLSFQKITKDLHIDLISRYRPIDHELEFLIDFYCYGCVAKTARWIRGGFKETPEEMLDSFIECLPEKLKEVFCFNEKMNLEDMLSLKRN